MPKDLINHIDSKPLDEVRPNRGPVAYQVNKESDGRGMEHMQFKSTP